MKPEDPSHPGGLAGAEVTQVLACVRYQSGAVASRDVVKNPNGSMSIFAFDEGQGLREHTAPFDAVVHVLEGDAEITIAGNSHLLQSGEMILMPARQPHALKAITRFTMILTKIRFEA